MGRFDYIEYDQQAAHTQAEFKKVFEDLDIMVEQHLQNGRAKSLVLTKLEEAYMWVGKAIRDEQVAGRYANLQEQRNTS